MKSEEIIQHRLSNQLISNAKFKTPLEIVSWLGAIQAQDYNGAKWSIGARIPEISEEINGQIYYISSYTADIPEISSKVYLLPGYDEYLLGYKERIAVLDEQYAEKICPGRNGVFNPTIVINGHIAGTWKAVAKKSTLTVIPQSFVPLTELEECGFFEAAKRYGRFLEKTVAFK